MVNIRQNKDFLATKRVTGVLGCLLSFFSSGLGEVALVNSCVHIGACRLTMGSIEVEESIIAQERCAEIDSEFAI